MKLLKLLEKKHGLIVDESLSGIQRARIDAAAYNDVSSNENRERFSQLLILLKEAIEIKSQARMRDYAHKIAEERFKSGYNLKEVYTAFNVLEEAIWNFIMKEVEPKDVGYSLGLVSTILGSGKEVLSVRYVELAQAA